MLLVLHEEERAVKALESIIMLPPGFPEVFYVFKTIFYPLEKNFTLSFYLPNIIPSYF